MLNRLLSYFYLYPTRRMPQTRTETTVTEASSNTVSNWWILAQFIVLIIGIIAKSFLDAYQSGTVSSLQLSWLSIIASSIIGIAIFPAVFKKTYDMNNPTIVQLCVTFTGGMGYQALFTAAVKAAGVS